jgi:hypothetical protein
MSRSKNDSTAVEEVTEEKKEIHIVKSKKELLMEKLKPYMDEEAYKMVKGRFKNYETPGASATIMCNKYPGIPGFRKDMMDDEVYEIPLYVARFLNGIDVTAPCKRIDTCSYAIHGYKWKDGEMPTAGDINGKSMVPVIHIEKRVRRYGFESLSFDSAEEV